MSIDATTGTHYASRTKESVRVRYGTGEIPMTGDRIQDAAQGMGTVVSISLAAAKGAEPSQVSVKWDEGIIDIDYENAGRFLLVARSSATQAGR